MFSHSAHKSWLKVSAIVIGGFGPFLTLATIPGGTEPARFVMDILTWPMDGFPDYQSDEIRFLSALAGGFLMGWAVTIWVLSTLAYDRAPEAVRKSLVYGALTWFVFDSLGSITSGNWSNAVFNIAVLLLVVGPMWTPAHDTTG